MLLLLVVGCNNHQVKDQFKINKEYFTKEYKLDNNEFNPILITYEQLDQVISMDKAVLMVSRVDCPHCFDALNSVNEYAKEHNEKVYQYILQSDTLSEKQRHQLKTEHALEYVQHL